MSSQPAPYHHGMLADALAEAAFRQVRVEGTAAVSLRSLAHELGVSPSAAYNHYADKEALLGAVAIRCQGELDTRMDQAAARCPGDADADLVARFRELGRAYITFAQQEPRLFAHAFMGMCDFEPQLLGQSHAFVLLCSVLDELDARSLLRPGIRMDLEMTIWVAVHGFAELALNGSLPFEAAASLLDSIHRLVLRDGIAPAP
ncbi:MAG: TetR/AcrR family transcriptional regulator [Candidatus Nanopelagicales bacterium]|nr:TetR/AcrR family transcriptional regulator [Candidatus Nanopelagicales bacterium]